MNKPLSERIQKMKLATDLPVDLVMRLDGFCRGRRVKKCDVIEIALRAWLAAQYEKEAAGG